jgi:hypothetical protein
MSMDLLHVIYKKIASYIFFYGDLNSLCLIQTNKHCVHTCIFTCREEIRRIKANNPDISHREAFSTAAKNVSIVCVIFHRSL